MQRIENRTCDELGKTADASGRTVDAIEIVDVTRRPRAVDAAALRKMLDRGQITGGIVDGPLAFDNAMSRTYAKAKHIVSPVAGSAEAAGLALGARVPIVLASRSGGVLSRLASCALAVSFERFHRHHASAS